ncbi:MAG: hypothetical protein WCF85_03060 [Rhodospirillaceae bacterium]
MLNDLMVRLKGAAPLYGGAIGNLITQGIDGGLLGSGIATLLSDVLSRPNSSFEHQKMAACYLYAMEIINERFALGERPRKDGFFDKPYNDFRPVACDILEGTLLKAKDQYELKKIQYFGYGFANTAFNEDISAAQALHFLTLIDRLTYHHIMIIGVVAKKKAAGLRLWERPLSEEAEFEYSGDTSVHLQQAYELIGMGILIMPFEDNDTLGANDLDSISPELMTLTRLGETIYRMFGMDRLPDIDINEAASWFADDKFRKNSV